MPGTRFLGVTARQDLHSNLSFLSFLIYLVTCVSHVHFDALYLSFSTCVMEEKVVPPQDLLAGVAETKKMDL